MLAPVRQALGVEPGPADLHDSIGSPDVQVAAAADCPPAAALARRERTLVAARRGVERELEPLVEVLAAAADVRQPAPDLGLLRNRPKLICVFLAQWLERHYGAFEAGGQIFHQAIFPKRRGCESTGPVSGGGYLWRKQDRDP